MKTIARIRVYFGCRVGEEVALLAPTDPNEPDRPVYPR
jgi:hypothetical protein